MLWHEFLPCHKNVYGLWYLNFTIFFKLYDTYEEKKKKSNHEQQV